MNKQYYHNIDLVNVGQLIGARKQNLSTADRNTLAGTLGLANEGLFVWDTDEKMGYTWDGAQFVGEALQIQGDVIFKGILDASTSLDAQAEAVSGYEYVVTTAGTLTMTGVTFSPSALVEVGDRVLFTSATQAYVQQRNDVEATETVLGNIRLASSAEVVAGTDSTKAVTSATLQNKLEQEAYVRQFASTVTLAAATPLTVTHNLGLVDKDSFTVNTMRNGSQISLDVDSVDANSITLTSLVALTDVRVTVQGAAAV